jgi:hypothetical protein
VFKQLVTSLFLDKEVAARVEEAASLGRGKIEAKVLDGGGRRPTEPPFETMTRRSSKFTLPSWRRME